MLPEHSPLLSMPAPQTIGLVGLGREGISSYSFLRATFPTATIWGCDDKAIAELDPCWQNWVKDDQKLKILTTAEWLAQPLSADLVVKTPGLPLDHSLITSPKLQSGIWTSNTQLFFEALPAWSKNIHRKIVTIGITGTKGKSTTSASIHHVLSEGGLVTILGGNIGKPALDLIADAQPENWPAEKPLYVVLELSCHQLATLPYSPNWAVIQNIVPEHLDYYPDFETYVQAKSQITRYQQSDDTVVYSPYYSEPKKLAQLSPGQHLLFGVGNDPTWEASVHDGQFWLKNQPVVATSALMLVGEHHWLNILPAIAIAAALGLTIDQIKSAIASFRGLPHRLERVAEKNLSQAKWVYYNDSLSTVPEAAQAALATFQNQPVVLIAGGYERHQDFTNLAAQIVAQKISGVVLFPPTGLRLWTAIQAEAEKNKAELPRHTVAQTMSEAVSQATSYLPDGGIVLLSPASPSFGTFKDYADRGDQFTRAARAA